MQVRKLWFETRDDGWRRVREAHVDPQTRQLVDDVAGEWEPPPAGSEQDVAERLAAKRAREALWVRGPAADPEERT